MAQRCAEMASNSEKLAAVTELKNEAKTQVAQLKSQLRDAHTEAERMQAEAKKTKEATDADKKRATDEHAKVRRWLFCLSPECSIPQWVEDATQCSGALAAMFDCKANCTLCVIRSAIQPAVCTNPDNQ